MATVTFIDRQDVGSQTKVRASVNIGTYATNGVTINASDFGLSILEGVVVEDSEGYAFDADIATGGATAKVKAYDIGSISISGSINAITAGTPAGTNSAPALSMASYTPAGTVAAPTVSSDSAGTPAGSVAAPTISSDSAGTPAGTNSAPALTMDSYTPAGSVAAPTVSSDSAGTPAGTNAASAVTATYLYDYSAIVKPGIALVHNADPAGGLNATALYVVEGQAGASENCGTLQSNNDSGVSVLGETADGTVFGQAASARFWVTHSNSPAGVPIYVNEGSSYRLEANFVSGTNCVLVLPMENPAGYGAAYIQVTIYHSATAATGKALYFDDNGAADAQLIFVATDTSNHIVPNADIAVSLGGATLGSAGQFGRAAAQVFSGSALGTHTHTAGAPAFSGTPATLTGSVAAPVFSGAALGTHTHTAGAPAFTGAALGTHTHTAGAPAFTGTPATLTGTVAAPVFTGSALGTHTHSFTGSGVASGPLTEVANLTDLSSITVNIEVFGR